MPHFNSNAPREVVEDVKVQRLVEEYGLYTSLQTLLLVQLPEVAESLDKLHAQIPSLQVSDEEVRDYSATLEQKEIRDRQVEPAIKLQLCRESLFVAATKEEPARFQEYHQALQTILASDKNPAVKISQQTVLVQQHSQRLSEAEYQELLIRYGHLPFENKAEMAASLKTIAQVFAESSARYNALRDHDKDGSRFAFLVKHDPRYIPGLRRELFLKKVAALDDAQLAGLPLLVVLGFAAVNRKIAYIESVHARTCAAFQACSGSVPVELNRDIKTQLAHLEQRLPDAILEEYHETKIDAASLLTTTLGMALIIAGGATLLFLAATPAVIAVAAVGFTLGALAMLVGTGMLHRHTLEKASSSVAGFFGRDAAKHAPPARPADGSPVLA